MTKTSGYMGVKGHLITGLIVIAPVGVTAFVLWWLFELLDGVLGRFFQPHLPFHIPGLGIIVLVLLLIGTGWVAERAIGGRVFRWTGRIFEAFPVTRGLYGASSRIVRTLFERERRAFRQVVLFEYPSDGRWSIGFVAAQGPPFARAAAGQDVVTIFMPTTPNPTTGFLVVMPRTKVVPVALSVEEAFTFILSVGTVTPDRMGWDAPAPVEDGGAGRGAETLGDERP
ncbi:MAG TPA: DUF502 domain-containing protein [Longimicrobiales bacterium]|nr:DUF502 domain-containing protein [Longimicrobiales bacterium]